MKKFILVSLFFLMHPTIGKAKSTCTSHVKINSLQELSQALTNLASKEVVIIKPKQGVYLKDELGATYTTWNDSLKSLRGKSIITTADGATVFFEKTGQKIILKPQTEIKIAKVFEHNSEVCQLGFQLIKGAIISEAEHKECLVKNKYEVETDILIIQPIGTKYSVDMNEELNSQDKNSGENSSKVFVGQKVKVEKGEIFVKLKKLTNKERIKNQKLAEKEDYADSTEDREPSFKIKKGQSAKIKKGKKDKYADIEIIMPED